MTEYLFAMRFLVDADSFPREAKDLVQRTAHRLALQVVMVANRSLNLVPLAADSPAGDYQIVVQSGPDAADAAIESLATERDLVFTRDILLAERLVKRGVKVLNDRGAVFAADTIRERISHRNFMEGMRDSGLAGSAGRSYGKRELQAFARALDHEVQTLRRQTLG